MLRRRSGRHRWGRLLLQQWLVIWRRPLAGVIVRVLLERGGCCSCSSGILASPAGAAEAADFVPRASGRRAIHGVAVMAVVIRMVGASVAIARALPGQAGSVPCPVVGILCRGLRYQEGQNQTKSQP